MTAPAPIRTPARPADTTAPTSTSPGMRVSHIWENRIPGEPTPLTDVQAATTLVLALHTPAGVTVPVAARALEHSEQWVRWELGSLPGVETLGPDLRTGQPRYRVAGPVVTDITLLAGALLALAERDWAQGEHEDELGRVDITGALRLTTNTHPEEQPEDPRALDALLAAEDTLAAALGHDPTQIDAGDTVARWQDHPQRTLDDVRALLLGVLTGTSR
ncbi:DUF6197 family protein [Candidatus Frankia nodulisporulans]|uniref:DUF6197 family protein n=1 Tax=Candidatus Frankia nodulisporulans TaxID=2060052 RepID=UPI0013CF9750|nr:hypothetical protein [Candidatus Frankia nodulisporulans]